MNDGPGRKLMTLKTKKLAALLAGFVLMVPIYVLLHEGGHACVALACGARITRFSLLGAYMEYTGGVFSPGALSLFHAAGMLLPVLISLVFMLRYHSGRTGAVYRILAFLFPLVPVASILAWVAVPVLYLWGRAPAGDDVTKFLQSSDLPPWAVSLVALALFCACLALAWRKRIPQNYWAAVRAGVS